MKIYSKADGLKKVKSVKNRWCLRFIKSQKQRLNYMVNAVTMYNLHTKNKNHSTNQNPYGLDMMKGVYLIPIEEGTCGYGLDGNLGEEPKGYLIKKKKEKIKEDIEMSKGVKKLMKIR